MCRAVIDLKTVDVSNTDDIPRPQWIPLKIEQDDEVTEDGPKILVGF